MAADGTAGQCATSQLQVLWFEPELGVLSMQCLCAHSQNVDFLLVFQYCPTSQKHASRWFGDSRLSLGMNLCLNMCMVPCKELVSYSGCFPTLYSGFPGYESLVTLTKIK